VTSMYGMFRDATAFSGNIGGWNTGEATDMQQMFYGATAFNQDIGGWDTGKVASRSSMRQMFRDGSSFNQDLSGWCVSNITSKPQDFDTGATAWTLEDSRPIWGTRLE